MWQEPRSRVSTRDELMGTAEWVQELGIVLADGYQQGYHVNKRPAKVCRRKSAGESLPVFWLSMRAQHVIW